MMLRRLSKACQYWPLHELHDRYPYFDSTLKQVVPYACSGASNVNFQKGFPCLFHTFSYYLSIHPTLQSLSADAFWAAGRQRSAECHHEPPAVAVAPLPLAARRGRLCSDRLELRGPRGGVVWGFVVTSAGTTGGLCGNGGQMKVFFFL